MNILNNDQLNNIKFSDPNQTKQNLKEEYAISKIKKVQIPSNSAEVDRDFIFLLQIEKQLSENISLIKLLKSIKINCDKNVHLNKIKYTEHLDNQ